MQKKTPEEDINQETNEIEDIKFGYGASVVFLIFIGFVIYLSWRG